MKKYLAEFIGTFGFIFLGCGTIIFTAPFIGYLGISLAFGLALSAMTFAFYDISGGHFNPAVTFALTLAGQFKSTTPFKTVRRFFGYLLAQALGAYTAAQTLFFIYSGKTGYVNQGIFGANIIDRYSLISAFCLETILCALFFCVFIGTFRTKKLTPHACAVGMTTIAAFLFSYPVTKGALNPLRTTAMALFSTEAALNQVWLFWVASFAAALIVGLAYNPTLNFSSVKETDKHAV